ncbi:hypothetical protein F0562_008339 [Nyssa sinensis]|uniref:F-box domain-containing protein n=1 Tax=Nyssa sinensis TaxID=561372 RepID=A0A5J5A8X3_9ASTE|nr:hypothetical protein F0562_008339 [Nyssa sinensis]
METRSVRRKKLLNAENEGGGGGGGGEDRISDLPDVVLHHILFLLPIRSIAQTSVLSKRWRHLWSSFPDLDFTSIDPIGNVTMNINSTIHRKRVHSPISKGIDFITQVLTRRDRNSDINILRFRARLSFSRLNGLIRLAVRHNVQELDVEVATNDYFNFPRSVITCESLRVFKMKSCYPGFRLPPSSIMKGGFRSLHNLSLSLLILHEQPSLLDLFTDSSFPHLKKLNLDACFGLKHLNVSCRSLEDLTLENCFQLDHLNISGGRLVRLRVASCFDAYSGNSCVKIDATRLRTILWEYNAITEDSSVENLTSLHEASMGFFVLHEDMSAAKLWSVSNFLSGLSHAYCLTLESQCVEIVSKNNHFAGVLLHPFNNLKSMELRTSFNKHNISGLACIFKSSPALHTLIIKIIHDYKTERRLDSNGTETYGTCLAPGKNDTGNLKAKS